MTTTRWVKILWILDFENPIFLGMILGMNDFLFANNIGWAFAEPLRILGYISANPYPPLSWINSFEAGILNMFVWLVGPSFIALVSISVAHLIIVKDVKTPLLYFAGGVFGVMATWDLVFFLLCKHYWTEEMMGSTVAWLPISLDPRTSEVFGINFSWWTGLEWILIRYLLFLLFMFAIWLQETQLRTKPDRVMKELYPSRWD